MWSDDFVSFTHLPGERMSIIAADFLLLPCANFVEDDVSMGGGAVGTGRVGAIVAQSDTLGACQVLSSNAGDTTQTATIRARHPSGVIETSNGVTLNGTTPITITYPSANNNTLRILWAQVSPSPSGTATFRSTTPVTMATVGPLYTKESSLFANSVSAVAGVTRYDKVFWYNNNGGGFVAETPVFRLTADPQTRIRQGVSTSKNDSATIANRVTAPAGITFVDDNVDQAGPASLSPADAQGVWIEFASKADDPSAPFYDSFTTQVTVASI